jgi:hypothetical protein
MTDDDQITDCWVKCAGCDGDFELLRPEMARLVRDGMFEFYCGDCQDRFGEEEG